MKNAVPWTSALFGWPDGSRRSYPVPEPPTPSGAIAGASVATIIGNVAHYTGKSCRRHWWNSAAARWDGLLGKPDSGSDDHYVCKDITGTPSFTDVEGPDRNTEIPTVYWDDANGKLHIVSYHNSQSEYWRIGYDTETDTYSIEVGSAGAGEPIPGIILQHVDRASGITVTPNGHVWIALANGSNLLVQQRTSSGWLTNAYQLQSFGNGNADLCWITDDDTNYLCVFAADDSQQVFYLLAEDDDPTSSGNWIDDSSNIPAVGDGASADDHVCIARASDHSLWIVFKDDADAIKVISRTLAGQWDGPYTAWAGSRGLTRPSCGIRKIDESDDEALVVAAGENAGSAIVYKSTPLDSVEFSEEAEIVSEGSYFNVTAPPGTFVATAESGYVVLTYDGTGAQHYGLLEIQAGEGAPMVEFSLIGGITSTSAMIKARIAADAGAKLKVSTSSDLSNPAAQVDGSETADSVYRFDVSGLSPATTYYYGFGPTALGSFRTAPAGPANFTIGVASCNNTGSNAATFARIKDRNLAFYIHMGDWGYPDIGSNSLNSFYTNYKTNLGAANQRVLWANCPIVYNFDDHDFGQNNSDGSSASRPAALQAYRHYVPHYPFVFEGDPDDTPITQTFVYGGVRFVILDTRSESVVAGRSAGQGELIGATQLAWLVNLIQTFTEPLMILDVQVPWIVSGNDVGVSDDWGHAQAERQAICDAIQQYAKGRVILIHGDMHAIAADDGTNTNFATNPDGNGPPLFASAPMDRGNSTKGGPYSEGVFDDSENQYGAITFEYEEGSLIVTFRGYEVDGASEQETVEFQVVVPGT